MGNLVAGSPSGGYGSLGDQATGEGSPVGQSPFGPAGDVSLPTPGGASAISGGQ